MSAPPEPLDGRKVTVTGIRTTPNAAYCEVIMEREEREPPLPSEPLYEMVGDFTVWRDRARRGVQTLLKSLPRYPTPPTHKAPTVPPLHPNWTQSLGRGAEATPKATPRETPPNPEDSPTRNRPPMPLPEEARKSDEEDDAYVYERVVTEN